MTTQHKTSTAGDLDRIVPVGTRVLMIVGGFGCGKTEVSVNLALQLAQSGRPVQIADMDLVNPYFRCREARELMERHHIRVVAPPGEQAWADVPIILPEIAGMLNPSEGMLTLFDVGGDDVGARALAAFRSMIDEGSYELWQVINSKRPFSDTPERCAQMRSLIEHASRLHVTGLLVNSHLVEGTTPDIVLEGLALGREVAAQQDLPVRGLAVMDELADDPALAPGQGGVDVPMLRLTRRMLPPWIRPAPDTTGDERHTGGSHG
jgi:hypothetical protein